jgi:hypothetical protein
MERMRKPDFSSGTAMRIVPVQPLSFSHFPVADSKRQSSNPAIPNEQSN